MAVIRPFRALRPPAERAQAVASVPYDVINTEEARALAAGNELSRGISDMGCRAAEAARIGAGEHTRTIDRLPGS